MLEVTQDDLNETIDAARKLEEARAAALSIQKMFSDMIDRDQQEEAEARAREQEEAERARREQAEFERFQKLAEEEDRAREAAFQRREAARKAREQGLVDPFAPMSSPRRGSSAASLGNRRNSGSNISLFAPPTAAAAASPSPFTSRSPFAQIVDPFAATPDPFASSPRGRPRGAGPQADTSASLLSSQPGMNEKKRKKKKQEEEEGGKKERKRTKKENKKRKKKDASVCWGSFFLTCFPASRSGSNLVVAAAVCDSVRGR